MMVEDRLTMSEGPDSHRRRDPEWGLCTARLISWPLITACSGQQAALHGHRGLGEPPSFPIRGEGFQNRTDKKVGK